MRKALVLLLLANLGCALLKRYSVQESKVNPSIYFERLEDIHYTQADWKIAVFLDIVPLQFNATLMNHTIQSIRYSCKHHPYFCGVLTKILNYVETKTKIVTNIYEDMIESISEVEPFDPTEMSAPPSIRRRSAPFGFIGSLSKSLFGTLSESDGEYLTNQIQQLFKGQTKLAKIAKENTHLVKNEISSIEEELKRSKIALNTTMHALMKTTNTIDDMKDIWQRSNFTREYSETISEIESALTIYQDTYKTILEAVRAARMGHLHPSLLTTNKLQQIIRQIVDLHPEYEFPIPIEHARTDKLIDIASTKTGFKKHKFIIEITIPLLNKFPTELYKMHAIPIPQSTENNKDTVFITPQASYIALSHDKRAYSFLSEQSLQKCKHTQHHRICTHDQPIHEADGDMACEYLLLNQPSLEN